MAGARRHHAELRTRRRPGRRQGLCPHRADACSAGARGANVCVRLRVGSWRGSGRSAIPPALSPAIHPASPYPRVLRQTLRCRPRLSARRPALLAPSAVRPTVRPHSATAAGATPPCEPSTHPDAHAPRSQAESASCGGTGSYRPSSVSPSCASTSSQSTQAASSPDARHLRTWPMPPPPRHASSPRRSCERRTGIHAPRRRASGRMRPCAPSFGTCRTTPSTTRSPTCPSTPSPPCTPRCTTRRRVRRIGATGGAATVRACSQPIGAICWRLALAYKAAADRDET